MTPTPEQAGRRGFLAVTVACAVAALAFLGIGLYRGQLILGLIGVVGMALYGVFLAVGRRRGEAVSLLAGEAADERQREITNRALAVTAQVLIAVIVVGALIGLAIDAVWTWAFTGLAAVSAVAFTTVIAVLSRRG